MKNQITLTSRRKLANLALGVSFLLYLSALVLKFYYRGEFVVELFYAVTEAAMIGGIADWFAVTALFRKPLGFSYHTALIPRNRVKLARAMANMVQNELLSAQSVREKLAKIEFVKLLIFFMEKKGGRVYSLEWIKKAIVDFLLSFDREAFQQKCQSFLQQKALKWNLLPIICRGGIDFLDRGQEQFWIGFLVKQLKSKVARPQTQTKIEQLLEKYSTHKSSTETEDSLGWLKTILFESAKAFDVINFKDAAVALQQELIKVLDNMESPEHPVRVWLKEKLHDVLQELSEDPEKSSAFIDWQQALVERVNLSMLLEKIVSKLIEDLTMEDKEVFIASRPATAWVLIQLERYWNIFLADQDKQEQLEVVLQEIFNSLFSSCHEWIGELVYDVLSRLPDEKLNELIEAKTGADLQWVRINGAIVGGAVGLALFLFLQYVYTPLVLTINFFGAYLF